MTILLLIAKATLRAEAPAIRASRGREGGVTAYITIATLQAAEVSMHIGQPPLPKVQCAQPKSGRTSLDRVGQEQLLGSSSGHCRKVR